MKTSRQKVIKSCLFLFEVEKKVLNTAESADFIKKQIIIPKYEVVMKVDDIKMKPPFVLKILSRDAIHKTEVNGVQIVKYPEELIPIFNNLINEAKKHKLSLDGIMVQEFIEGIESIIGIKNDPTFGHVILFGLGGIFTEIIKDTSTRKCPITLKDAEEMIEELKSSKVFHEFRGIKTNIENLKKTLVKISNLPKNHPEIEELDINPFTINNNGWAVDARVVISRKF